jgi:hypothetical protein
MPFVSRPSPPSYDPTKLASLIVRYDTSIQNSILSNASGIITKVLDQTSFDNDATSKNAYVLVSIDGNISPIALNSNAFLLNNSTEMRYKTTGVTVFVVGSPGFPVHPTDLISIFGTSNSSRVSSGNAAFLRIDSENYLYATNGINNAGPRSLLVNDSNIPKIITCRFDKTNSTLRISGNDYGTSTCPNIFEGDNNYIIQIGTPDNYYNIDRRYPRGTQRIPPIQVGLPTSIQAGNGIVELLVYNSPLSSQEIITIEQYLAEKWRISYPVQDTRNYPDVMQIPQLSLWLDPTNSNNIVLNGGGSENPIDFITSSDNLLNTFRCHFTLTTNRPNYIQTRKTISFYNTSVSPLFPNGPPPIDAGYQPIFPIFTGAGDLEGLTVFTVLGTSALRGDVIDYQIATILAALVPEDPNNLVNVSYPTILQDKGGNLFTGSNVIDITNQKKISFNTGTDGSLVSPYANQPFLLTTRFTTSNIQFSVNGYMFPIISTGLLLSNIVPYIVGSNLGCYIGGDPSTSSNYNNCSSEIGEVLIYKKILNETDTAIVNTHIYSNYNISREIDRTGLIGWWDANEIAYNNFGSNVVTSWEARRGGGGPTITNISSNSVAYLRKATNPLTNTTCQFVDFNNGIPSIMANLSPISISSPDISIFIVTTGNYNSSGTAVYTPEDITIGSAYDVPTQSIKMNLLNSTTNLTSRNIFYLSTYSITTNRTDNIFSIPNYTAGNNTLTADIFGLSDSISYLSIGGNYNDSTGVSSSFFQNSICELLIYNKVLSNGEYTNILAYLQSKWGFPWVTGGPPNNIPDLNLWYDANDLNVGDTTWRSVNTPAFGPTLTSTTPANINIYNNNKFLNLNTLSDNFSSDNIRAEYEITQSYTFFVVSGNVNPGSEGTIMSINPAAGSDSNYPGLYRSNTSFTIINGITDPFSQSSRCYSLTKDSTNYPAINLNSVNITCISHSNDLDMKGYYKIRAKGTLFEQVDTTHITESPFLANAILTIGASTPAGLNFYKGDMGEFLFYNRCLNDLEIESVFKYLEGKWLNSGGSNNPCY